jgi:two-component system uhpT operon response regulator UhpA
MCSYGNDSDPDDQVGRSGASGILVVDDHTLTQELVTALLARAFPRRKLTAVGTAELALQLCAREKWSLVVMDIGLPGMNGIEATRRIKELYPETVLVVHSNNDSSLYREAAFAAGAAAFVDKGRSATELVPAIAALLASSDPTGSI